VFSSPSILPIEHGGRYRQPFMKKHIVSNNLEIMGGTPVFKGTRVPIQTLIDYLEEGENINGFLAGFPTVTHKQVIDLLEKAKEKILFIIRS